MISTTPPEWMLGQPEAPESPRPESRVFHRKQMYGWFGYAPLEEIEYWPQNRRTDVQVGRLLQRSRLTSRESLSNEQLVDLLLDDPDLDIKGLAENIMLNELRQPLIISHDGELLDGNRRYLAHCWIQKYGDMHQQERASQVRVWVLAPENSSERDKMRVVTEYNFLSDFRMKWSDFVRAKLLYEERAEGLTWPQINERYSGAGMTPYKIKQFVRTYEIIAEFLEKYPGDEEALDIASEHFIWFQQLQRSNREEIRNDDEFREVVFENIRNGDVRSTDHLKNLNSMRKFREAWKLFRDGEVKAAHIVREGLELEEQRANEPEQLMNEINGRLERLVTSDGYLDNVSQETRFAFHELSLEVPGHAGNVLLRIENLLRQLASLTSEELDSLPEEYVVRLENALERVSRQARATTVG